MSEQKRISPLLDGFSMGNPISEHDGVCCCPAIKENTDKKYIVKIISIPATQVQMDALLFAGAYKDPADAMEYFQQIGEGILQEAELLKTLARLDGFLAYDGWQMEPITRRRLGYEVYLVGSYKRSLEKYLKKHPVTHLEAINLGLDLCAALTICREAGALYVSLKPSNVFVSEKKDYRIGDLGFIQLDALNYTALPEKYQSAYTPPELFDPMASLNLTADTYALGMILYQLYNDGQLPFKGKQAPAEIFPPPLNADYEMAEIIMKAIHPNPDERWTDPRDLGKALASYMQKNGIDDVPITPYTPLDVKPEDIVVIPSKKKLSDTNNISEDNTISVESPAVEIVSESVENGELLSEEAVEILDTNSTEIVQEDISAVSVDETVSHIEDEKESENSENQENYNDSERIDDTEEVPTETLSDDVAEIIEKANDLISYEAPEEVLFPQPENIDDPFDFVNEDSDEIDESDFDNEEESESNDDSVPELQVNDKKKRRKKFEDPKYKRRKTRILTGIICLLLGAAVGLGGFWYYQNMYLQVIHSLTIEGDREQILITVDSDIAEGKLSATCTDNYGNAKTIVLTGGKASFTDITPNTFYTIDLHIDGFHKLVGKISDVYVSDATTRIVSFTSVAGSEDGSVKLNFTVDGEEPNDWTVYYSADGEDEKRKSFAGHSVDISGLTIGKVYTFRLDTGENISLDGQTTLELMASRLILAEDLAVTSTDGTDITVRWNAPGDIIVDSWDVRCYNDIGYEEKVTVNETQVSFPGIDPSFGYTIEITASGMTQPVRTSISANPIHISELQADDSRYDKLGIHWNFTGEQPKDGWLVMYSFVGGQKNVVKSNKPFAEITPKIPGAKYEISVQAADGTTVFNNQLIFACPDGASFAKHNLTAEQLEVDLVITPDEDHWRYEDHDNEIIQSDFEIGDTISIALRSADSFYLTGAEVDILYIIRDAYGNVLPDLVAEETVYWKDIWNNGDVKIGELTIPKIPQTSGEYELSLYFDGMLVKKLPFTITP